MNTPLPASALRLTISTLAILVIAGCSQNPFDRDPKISGIDMSPQTMPEVARVQVPMPPPEVERAPERGEASSLWQRGSGGFFTDQRATRIGDILTIIIEINDDASLSNASDRERSGASQLAKPSFFGYGGQLHKLLPGVSAADLPANNIVDISSNTTASGSGNINRNETINLRIAALVVQMLPNGNMVVAGRRLRLTRSCGSCVSPVSSGHRISRQTTRFPMTRLPRPASPTAVTAASHGSRHALMVKISLT